MLRTTAQLRARRHDGEEGATAVLSALVMTIVLVVLAFAIDTGSLVLGSRDMQGAIDLAALDAVQALGELADGDPTARAQQLAEESLARNDGWSNRDGRTVTTEVGRFDEATRSFTPTLVEPNAVLVTGVADLGRVTNFVPGDDVVSHTAVATLRELSGVGIGTSVASLDTEGTLLQNLLLSRLFGSGSTLALDAVAYQGLAAGTIDLGVLAGDLGLASPEELVDSTVDVRQLLQVAASGLTSSGDPLDIAAAAPLLDVAAVVDPAAELAFGDLVAGSLGSAGAVADLEMGAFDLVSLTAQAVNGGNAVDLGLPIAIPGVGSGNLTLAVIEPAQYAFGPAGRDAAGELLTVARSAQVRLGIDLDLVALDLGVVDVSALDLPITVEAGQGTAGLEAIGCSAAGTPTVRVPVSTAGVTTTIGQLPADLTSGPFPVGATAAELASVEVDLPLLPAIDAGQLTALGQYSAGGVDDVLDFTGPYAEHREVGGSSSLGGLPGLTASFGEDRVGLAAALGDADLGLSAAGLLGGVLDPVADVLDPILDAVTPILDQVDGRIVGPLLGSLGVNLGSADVVVPSVDCGIRTLVR